MTMFTNPQRVVTEEAKELRKAAGAFLRAVRERQGLTQHDVGTFAGYRYYTQYSALEQGTGRVPPERYAAIAAALGLAPSYFARKMMRYYDPLTFAAVLDEADIDHKVMVLSAPLEAPALVPELSAEDAKTLRREAGTLVKTLREEAGMTQADLAEMCGLSRKATHAHLIAIEAAGAIRRGYGAVHIRDASRLAWIAEAGGQ